MQLLRTMACVTHACVVCGSSGTEAVVEGESYITPLKKCSRCAMESYCSAECQRAAWPAHKLVCHSQVPRRPTAGSMDAPGTGAVPSEDEGVSSVAQALRTTSLSGGALAVEAAALKRRKRSEAGGRKASLTHATAEAPEEPAEEGEEEGEEKEDEIVEEEEEEAGEAEMPLKPAPVCAVAASSTGTGGGGGPKRRRPPRDPAVLAAREAEKADAEKAAAATTAVVPPPSFKKAITPENMFSGVELGTEVCGKRVATTTTATAASKKTLPAPSPSFYHHHCFRRPRRQRHQHQHCQPLPTAHTATTTNSHDNDRFRRHVPRQDLCANGAALWP